SGTPQFSIRPRVLPCHGPLPPCSHRYRRSRTAALLRIFFLARLFARPLRSRFCWSSAVKFHGSSAPSAVLRVLGCSVRQPKSSPPDLIARLSGGPLRHPPFSLSSSLPFRR